MTAPTELGSDLLGQLRDWLPNQRWFGAKGREITTVGIAATAVLREAATADGPRGDLVLLAVDFTDRGPTEHYQLLLGRRGDLPADLEHALIGRDPDMASYDGLWDAELTGELLADLAAGVQRDWVRFNPEPGATIGTELPGRVLGAEQSNTSVAFGEQLLLKLYRRVSPGVNPDLELHRALREVGSEDVATLRGAIEGTVDDEPTVLGMVQDFAANSADGWSMALISVRDLFAEADLRADEVGGDFAGEAHRLGATVATVHQDLARALGTASTTGAELAAAMRSRLEQTLPVVPELEELADPLRAAFARVADLPGPVVTQRLHGDLHLGQALRTPYRWLLIDFEGEPARPLAERRHPDSVLRDVAAMLRSFDYAAYHQCTEWGNAVEVSGRESQLLWHADEWAQRNRSAFCDGYAEVTGADPRQHEVLLRAFELDKAVYEAAYETRNRPSWVVVPLRSLRQMLTG